jgi:hypothetical protein
MKLLLIMQGKDKLQCIEDPELNQSSYSGVLNFQSKFPFIYYKTEKTNIEVIQYALSTIDKSYTHLLYLGSNVIMNEFELSLFEDLTNINNILIDTDSLESAKICLISITDDIKKKLLSVPLVMINFNSEFFSKNLDCNILLSRVKSQNIEFNECIKEINNKHLIEISNTITNPSIYLATHCLTNQVSCNYTCSLVKTLQLCSQNQIGVNVDFLYNSDMNSYNLLVYNFLNTNNSHLLFINPDLQWNAEDVIKLINHKKDICVGLYSNNQFIDDTLKKVKYSSIFYTGENMMENSTKLMKIKYGSSGFMLISRKVFEILKNEVDYYYTENNKCIYNFFSGDIVGQNYLSADFNFCEKWKKKGGEIWADLSICLNKEGLFTYMGNPLETFN